MSSVSSTERKVETTKTVAVLGCAYGGWKATQTLLANIPRDWKIIAIDRNSHFNRHEHMAFMPFKPLFDLNSSPTTPPPPSLHFSPDPKSPLNPNHRFIQGDVKTIDIENNTITFKPLNFENQDQDPINRRGEEKIEYDYLVHSLGSSLPDPINVWKGAGKTGKKVDGVEWMKRQGSLIKGSHRKDGNCDVLIVGGGALGVEFAGDIKEVYPEKRVILIHSRPKLLNRFDDWMDLQARSILKNIGVEVITGERVISDKDDPKTFITTNGRKISTSIVLWCTGQNPQTSLLPLETIDKETGEAYVTRTMQLATMEQGNPKKFGRGNVFVIGDGAQAFGARKAGHTAAGQGQVAGLNIARLIYNSTLNGEEEELEEYKPPRIAIKVTVGFKNTIVQNKEGGFTRKGPEGLDDLLNADNFWINRGAGDIDRHL